MIYVKLFGRLGNNLFQLATAACLARNMGDTFQPVIDKEVHDLWGFHSQFGENVLKSIPYPIDINESDIHSAYKETHYTYLPIVYSPNMLLSGYFQSYKYLDEHYVKQLFGISPEIKNEIVKKYPQLKNARPTAINVRRGDFLGILDKYPFNNINYFRRAIKKVEAETDVFIVCSDDIGWCKEQFNKIKTREFIFIENEPIYIQFYIQTLCTINIISNSTFSWWAAYLNIHEEKRVIRPKTWWYWYDKKELTDKDLIPSTWESVENHLPPAYYLQYLHCCYKNRFKPFIKKKVFRSTGLKLIYKMITRKEL